MSNCKNVKRKTLALKLSTAAEAYGEGLSVGAGAKNLQSKDRD
jgi:hypothetical protein